MNDFDEMSNYYDSHLSSTLNKADYMISQISRGHHYTTQTDYIIYVALGPSAINFFIIMLYCLPVCL